MTSRARFFMPMAVGLIASSATTALADPLTIPASRFGNYASDGIGNINSPAFQNYFVGYSTPSATAERRNFFTFSTASLSGLTVVSGSLSLYVPLFAPGVTTDPGFGYISPDPTETYVISGTPIPAAELGDPTNSPGESIPIFGTLGTGPVYGFFVVGPGAMGGYIDIPLTGTAIAALNDAAGLGATFAIGGQLVTLSRRAGVFDELVFSFTDVPGSGTFAVPTLHLEVVPAPGAISLLALGGTLAMRRRRTR